MSARYKGVVVGSIEKEGNPGSSSVSYVEEECIPHKIVLVLGHLLRNQFDKCDVIIVDN